MTDGTLPLNLDDAADAAAKAWHAEHAVWVIHEGGGLSTVSTDDSKRRLPSGEPPSSFELHRFTTINDAKNFAIRRAWLAAAKAAMETANG